LVRSWQAGRVVRAGHTNTIADALVMQEPDPEAVRRMRALADDVILVTDPALLHGMRLAARTLGLLIEPSAAAGLAAIAQHDLPGRALATVLTGTDPRPDLLAQALEDRTEM
jgi:threonine dehydratase